MKSHSLNKYCVWICATLITLLALETKAQKIASTTSNQGKVLTLYSKILHEKRKILIYTPKDTKNPAQKYQVVYVLDADNHFAQMVEYAKYLSRQDVYVIPPLLVVGITNTDRNRDLTPSHSVTDYGGKIDTTGNSPYKNSGGNANFLHFIEKELIPYVDANYQTQPYRIFAGHSFGGLTVINCLLNYPDMFNAYIAVSPSFWWDQQMLLKLAAQKLKAGSTLSKTLFFSDGNEGSSSSSGFHADVLKFDTLLKNRKLNTLDFKYVAYPAESHMTVPIKSYYDGLRFVYQQWTFPPVKDEEINQDIVMKHYQQLSKRFGYTILPDEAYFNDLAQWLVKTPSTLSNGINLLEMNTVNYPYSSKAFAALGAAYAITGEKQKAIASYKKAMALAPRAKEVKSRLLALQK